MQEITDESDLSDAIDELQHSASQAADQLHTDMEPLQRMLIEVEIEALELRASRYEEWLSADE